jgi:hypothetical protein
MMMMIWWKNIQTLKIVLLKKKKLDGGKKRIRGRCCIQSAKLRLLIIGGVLSTLFLTITMILC